MKEISIADHALLRYIERVQGISLDPIREEIYKIVTTPAVAGASTFTHQGFTFCFVEHEDKVVVTTILSDKMRRNSYVKNSRKMENRRSQGR